ncbi:MAG: deacylase [Ignavibacteriae bacterium]|nr:deacylase [Ignavibacteriota bacterium]
MNLGMLKLFKLVVILFFIQNLYANQKSIDFDFIKKGQQDDNTLLIVGGIQGDEPGAFMAASLITTHYKVNKGSVWVVPNLNFYSIIKRSRGPFGDMNRKFAALNKNDPDYKSIQRIKSYIRSPNVKVILNLHDGSGFYREKFIDKLHSPRRWGQSSIIDQANLDIEAYGNLEDISKEVCSHVNKNLIRERDSYSVKNTHTRLGDKEMEKTLTYFAINNGKAAFGNEASKVLPLFERTYYHLVAMEKYMDIMGIEFERKFDLNPKSVKNVINNDIYISFYDDKIQLPLGKVRNILKYFPIKKDGTLEFTPSNPLMTVIKNNNTYMIYYGNKKLARLKPDYLDIEEEQKDIIIQIDGKQKVVKLGSIIDVNESFVVEPLENFRVNIIGFVKKGRKDESGLKVNINKIPKRFSIDRNGKIFRVEFYKDNKFAGMVLVNFDKTRKLNQNLSTASKKWKMVTAKL